MIFLCSYIHFDKNSLAEHPIFSILQQTAFTYSNEGRASTSVCTPCVQIITGFMLCSFPFKAKKRTPGLWSWACANGQRAGVFEETPARHINDYTADPLSFFEKHPRAEYLEETSRVGRDGEEEALRMEQEQLSEQFHTLHRLVIPYFKLRRSSPRYDILSFDEHGRPFYIEVKTTGCCAFILVKA